MYKKEREKLLAVRLANQPAAIPSVYQQLIKFHNNNPLIKTSNSNNKDLNIYLNNHKYIQNNHSTRASTVHEQSETPPTNRATHITSR